MCKGLLEGGCLKKIARAVFAVDFEHLTITMDARSSRPEEAKRHLQVLCKGPQPGRHLNKFSH
jgi:hypothetical protein